MKTFNLPFQKSRNPISYKQLLELRSSDNLSIEVVSNSQIQKRLDVETFEKITKYTQSGKKCKLIG